MRIKSIHSDLRDPIKEYNEEGVGDKEARCKCLRQIAAIPHHHSGDHSECFQEKYCTFIEVKNANPTWTYAQVEEEAAKKIKRHGGKYMSMGKKAIGIVSDCIGKTFNDKTIDRIARCGNSNASEAFFGNIVQYSEGKRLNLDQADTWQAMSFLSICNAGLGNIEKTHMEMSEILCLQVNEVEIVQRKIAAKKSEKDSARMKGKDFKDQRSRAGLLKASAMGKEAAKKTRHKSAKVPLSESSMVSKQSKKKTQRKCGICRQPGHTKATCSMPRMTKRKVDKLLDWEHETKAAPVSKKPRSIILFDW